MKSFWSLLIILVCCLSQTCFSQGPIKVKLSSGDEIHTRYAYLSNGYSFDVPFVRIDGKKGRKIPISSISYVEGTDQDGTYRYFEPIYRFRKIWAERSYVSDRIKIYYTNIETGSWDFTYRSKYYVYKKDESAFKKLKMKNLKLDLADNVKSMDHLKKGKTLQWIQAALYVSGAAILVGSVVKEFSNNELTEPGENPGIPAGIIVGGISLNIPWFLNPVKQKHFTNALKAYN